MTLSHSREHPEGTCHLLSVRYVPGTVLVLMVCEL